MLRWILLFTGLCAAQTWNSTEYNAAYEPAAGWSASTAKITDGVARITATRIGLQPVYMSFYKHATQLEATYHRGDLAATEIAIGSQIMHDQDAGDPIAYLIDTTQNGSKFIYGSVDRGYIGSTPQIELFFASSNGLFSQAGAIVTTEADLTANYQHYFLAFLGASYQSKAAALKASAIEAPKLDLNAMFNAMGRRSRTKKAGFAFHK